MNTITLTGWTHVHTYHESHGNHVTEIYQRDIDPRTPWFRRVELLNITTYRDGSAMGIRTESGDHTHDYLLAREIRANVDGRYVVDAGRGVTACATAGWDNFRDTQSDTRYRIFGAAGHGEWAFKLGDDD